MAVALAVLKKEGAINTAYVLDIDLHFGDGSVDILGGRNGITDRELPHPFQSPPTEVYPNFHHPLSYPRSLTNTSSSPVPNHQGRSTVLVNFKPS
jgi:acetoin utilization deacetylase AcuC-like enzyme